MYVTACVYVCMCVCVYVCMCVYVYMCICVCICNCMGIRVYYLYDFMWMSIWQCVKTLYPW